jgi:hypothetical protein
MATRPRAPTPPPKKSAAPPFSGSALDDDARNAPPVLTDAVDDEQAREEDQSRFDRGSLPEITESTLEQRDIPSFSESREARIAEAAYWRAERRGFLPGHELDDWLDAEKEIDAGDESAENVPKTG